MVVWLSWLERSAHTREVGGSSPPTTTIWPLGQSVKTSPFHGGVRSSTLLGVTNIKNNPAKFAGFFVVQSHNYNNASFFVWRSQC